MSQEEANQLLLEAAKTGRLQEVRQALQSGADVNATNEYGTTALILASCFGHIDIVKALLTAQADVHIADKSGYGASIRAQPHPDIVIALMSPENWGNEHFEAVRFSHRLNAMLGQKAGYPLTTYTDGDFSLLVGAARAAREEKAGKASIRLGLCAVRGDNVAAFAGHVAERLGVAFEGMGIQVVPDRGNRNRADIVLTYPAKDFGRFDVAHLEPLLLDWLQDEYVNIKASLAHCARDDSGIEYPDHEMHRRRLVAKGSGSYGFER